MPIPSPEQKKKIEATLIDKANKILMQMQLIAQNYQNLDQLKRAAEALESLLKSKDFPSSKGTEIKKSSRQIQCAAFQLGVDSLLREAENKARDDNNRGCNEAVAEARRHCGAALRLGADEAFSSAVESRIQQVLLTSKEGIDERTKQSAKRKLDIEESKNAISKYKGQERRRARRYISPELTINIDDLIYKTANWSTRGVLIDICNKQFNYSINENINTVIFYDEITARNHQSGRVVRVEENFVAIDFMEISFVVLDIMHVLHLSGIEFEEN